MTARITLNLPAAENAGARFDEAYLGAPIAPNPREALELLIGHLLRALT